MANWEFEHSIYTEANRKDAWDHWSDVENHAKMEPGVESIELDGPFATGTTGRTITSEYTQEWELTTVIDGEKWVITGHTPDGGGTLSFAWKFEDEGSGTRLTQQIKATGSLVEEYPEEIQQMEANAPKAMARLAKELNRLAEEEWNKK
ncbi:SRPBCC family protein [Aliifodinibius sp. S!AR15-10]|uniref:SRPBCC family protein n=1 Tax=Aliifodinibius sp. S!AR15-10 TaxID=2950437 RepID=UPI002858E994|nr:SRPBCC family protein [Aliifodinibius sp. S!AR15-10]MDR8394283.1 SRPBCC family protein [Aliifodinibius sp. S!AR15-10]